MPKLQLPDVTLVMIDTLSHRLACMAVEDCLDKVDFGDVLIFTDRPEEFASLKVGVHRVPNWPTKLEFEQFRWSEVSPHLTTSHALFIEWDAWVWDTSQWTDDFLKYDYIGPPWRYGENQNVGGGGFCLVSTKLKQYLRDHPEECPLAVFNSDWLLCCEYRPRLEEKGFVWAPEDLANQFAFEYYRPSADSRHFGFHGAFNFNEVLSPERLEERTRLLLAAHYIQNRDSHDVVWPRFQRKNAALLKKLADESVGSKMNKLQLPNVTLVMLETQNHVLARMAVEDCLDKVDFGDVLIFTDRPLEFSPLTKSHNITPHVHPMPNWPTKLEWCQFRWSGVSPYLTTSHALFIEWDAWIWDTTMWSDEFMKYDYIGAPWWYQDGKNVGNGGFNLISTRLKRYLRDKQWDLPCIHAADDDLLCRKYRPQLEELGFVWAPEKLAHQFAFECCRPTTTSKHFGFHAMFNWGDVLSPERLRERVKLAMASDYITNPRGVIWQAFVSKHSELVDELLIELSKENSKEPSYGQHSRISRESVS